MSDLAALEQRLARIESMLERLTSIFTPPPGNEEEELVSAMRSAGTLEEQLRILDASQASRKRKEKEEA